MLLFICSLCWGQPFNSCILVYKGSCRIATQSLCEWFVKIVEGRKSWLLSTHWYQFNFWISHLVVNHTSLSVIGRYEQLLVNHCVYHDQAGPSSPIMAGCTLWVQRDHLNCWARCFKDTNHRLCIQRRTTQLKDYFLQRQWNTAAIVHKEANENNGVLRNETIINRLWTSFGIS